jgi:transposase-like protein
MLILLLLHLLKRVVLKKIECKYCKSENILVYQQKHSEFPDRTHIKCNDCNMSYEIEDE